VVAPAKLAAGVPASHQLVLLLQEQSRSGVQLLAVVARADSSQRPWWCNSVPPLSLAVDLCNNCCSRAISNARELPAACCILLCTHLLHSILCRGVVCLAFANNIIRRWIFLRGTQPEKHCSAGVHTTCAACVAAGPDQPACRGQAGVLTTRVRA
jgi:hypothetical protein